MRIEFPDSWNASDADAFVDALLRRGLPGISYLQITERLDALLGMWAERDDIYTRNMQLWQDDSRNWAADGTGKLRATRLRLEEYRFAVRRHFLARLARLLSDKDLERLTEQVKRLVEDGEVTTLAAIVTTMPSVELNCEMHVQYALNVGRRPRKQDFYDHEHAALAIPRVDAFVTTDGGLLNVLRQSRVTSARSCHLLRGMDALASYLTVLDRG